MEKSPGLSLSVTQSLVILAGPSSRRLTLPIYPMRMPGPTVWEFGGDWNGQECENTQN